MGSVWILKKGVAEMKTLILYDTEGYILTTMTGGYKVPVGIPYIEIEIPQGKRIATIGGIGVDVTKTPHEVILEDIPPSELEVIKAENKNIKASVAELAELILGGM